jgi:hypothetical protein
VNADVSSALLAVNVFIHDWFQNGAGSHLEKSSFGLRLRLGFWTMWGYGGICQTHRTTLPSSSRMPYLIIVRHQVKNKPYQQSFAPCSLAAKQKSHRWEIRRIR